MENYEKLLCCFLYFHIFFFQISHNWPSWFYIVPIIIFSISYNLPKFCELKVGHSSSPVTVSDADNATSHNLSNLQKVASTFENNSVTNLAAGYSGSDANNFSFLVDTWQISENINSNVSVPLNIQNDSEKAATNQMDLSKVTILPTQLRLNPWYFKIYLIYMNMITHGIIPMLTLTLLNMAIYREVSIELSSIFPPNGV